MISVQNLNNIFNILVQDEAICRLFSYGLNPLSSDKPDIIPTDNTSPEYQTFLNSMKDIIKFVPQVNEIAVTTIPRICIYKAFTKIGFNKSAVRNECIQIEIFVPCNLAQANDEFRVYDIENKLVALLDGLDMGVGYLDYVDGTFIDMPRIVDFVEYRMALVMKESRIPLYAKR